MSILLGIRMAFAGGRESLARMSLMAVGVAVGVPLILLALSAVPVMQSHIDRLAWHRTTADSAPTAPDRAMWLAVTDRYDGRDIIRVHVAALGPQPPKPPGVERLPGPGEKLVSPALAELMRVTPDEQLDNRFPGRVAGGIGPDGLIMPDELVAIVGHTPEQMRAMPGAHEIRGVERPGERLDLAELLGIFFGMIAVLVVGPVVVFVAMTTRIGGARREQRFAAVRLAGATRLQTAMLATVETAVAALAGTLLGWLAFLALRPAVASVVTLGHGMPIFPADIAVPLAQALVVVCGVPLVAVATTLLAIKPVQMTPLDVRRRGLRPPPRLWRLAPIGVGLLGYWYAVDASSNPENADNAGLGQLTALSMLCTLVGFFLAGAWVCMWISRGMARLSRRATTLIVARRIAADPYATFRAISGAALAIFVATQLGFAVAMTDASDPERPSAFGAAEPALDPGVVAVHVRGVPDSTVAPLMSDGVVVARFEPRNGIVVSCADLARVTDLECPLPRYLENGDDTQPFLQMEDLFTLPHPNPSGADHVFQPLGFREPVAGDPDRLGVQTLFVPTDGSLAAQERVRTLAASLVPQSRSKTREDLTTGPPVDVTAAATILPYAMVFVLLFTACALTVSVIAGVLERRRPFALLRASGVRLGELRRIVLLETGVPLALTVLLGVGLATLQSLAPVPPEDWILPSTGYFVGLGAGVLASFVVSLVALPFMNTATRLDTVRFE